MKSNRRSGSSLGGNLSNIFDLKENPNIKRRNRSMDEVKTSVQSPATNFQTPKQMKQQKTQEFQPFKQERDSMNRLIFKPGTKAIKFQGAESTMSQSSTVSTPRIRKNQSQSQSMGSYPNQSTEDRQDTPMISFLGSQQQIELSVRDKNTLTYMLGLDMEKQNRLAVAQRASFNKQYQYDHGCGKFRKRSTVRSLDFLNEGATRDSIDALVTDRQHRNKLQNKIQLQEDEEKVLNSVKNYFKVHWQTSQRPDLMLRQAKAKLNNTRKSQLNFKNQNGPEKLKDTSQRDLEYLMKPSPAFASIPRENIHGSFLNTQEENMPSPGQYPTIELDLIKPKILPRTIARTSRFATPTTQLTPSGSPDRTAEIPNPISIDHNKCLFSLEKSSGRLKIPKLNLIHQPLETRTLRQLDSEFRFKQEQSKRYDSSKIKQNPSFNVSKINPNQIAEFKDLRKQVYKQYDVNLNPRKRTFFSSYDAQANPQ